MTDERETVWLIERGQRDNHIPTIWLKSLKARNQHEPYHETWTEIAHEAQHFSTEKEALVIAEHIGLCRPTNHIFLGQAKLAARKDDIST